MFAPIFAILLLLSSITLPNGIRLIQAPDEGETSEILAGYDTGTLPNLSSMPAARAITLAAYSAGGDVEFVNAIDRSGFRTSVPRWAEAMVLSELPGFFKDVPSGEARPRLSNLDFRAKVEEEIRSALIGSASDNPEYATDRAFVVTGTALPDAVRERLASIPKRASTGTSDAITTKLAAERTFRFTADLPAGAVIFASPVPSVHYRQWYLVLLLDRLIQRVVPLKLSTALPLAVRPYYYRMELAVPSGQFPEPVEENLLQEIQRLQFTRANAKDLEAARQDARSFLESKFARRWFATHDIARQRDEGVQWLQTITADDLRAAARDLLIVNRVIATWAPKPKQTSISIERLSGSSSAATGESARGRGDDASFPLPVFPAHTHEPQLISVPERLPSGVSIVASTAHAVFVSGDALTRFDNEPGADTPRVFQKYRADRILVLAPPASMARARQLWTLFKGAPIATTGEIAAPRGKVTTTDLPALFVLNVLLDRKLIESGLWSEAHLHINASHGSELQIEAQDNARTRIGEWIKRIGSEKPSDAEIAWAREVALHRSHLVLPDLQALIWERDPQGTLIDIETVTAAHVQDVARIYFN